MSGAPIAVVGVSALLPESADLTTFWENVREARDCFRTRPTASAVDSSPGCHSTR